MVKSAELSGGNASRTAGSSHGGTLIAVLSGHYSDFPYINTAIVRLGANVKNLRSVGDLLHAARNVEHLLLFLDNDYPGADRLIARLAEEQKARRIDPMIVVSIGEAGEFPAQQFGYPELKQLRLARPVPMTEVVNIYSGFQMLKKLQ